MLQAKRGSFEIHFFLRGVNDLLDLLWHYLLRHLQTHQLHLLRLLLVILEGRLLQGIENLGGFTVEGLLLVPARAPGD